MLQPHLRFPLPEKICHKKRKINRIIKIKYKLWNYLALRFLGFYNFLFLFRSFLFGVFRFWLLILLFFFFFFFIRYLNQRQSSNQLCFQFVIVPAFVSWHFPSWKTFSRVPKINSTESPAESWVRRTFRGCCLNWGGIKTKAISRCSRRPCCPSPPTPLR